MACALADRATDVGIDIAHGAVDQDRLLDADIPNLYFV
jgi:hypothetical protein